MKGRIWKLVLPCTLGLLSSLASALDRTVVYAMDNNAANNRVFAFRVSDQGSLTPIGRFSTHGRGTGTSETPLAGPVDGIDPLGSQGSLVLSRNGRFLLAVNAGSGTVSLFRVLGNGFLLLVDVEPTGGRNPVSVTSWGNRIYVANVNDPTANQPSTITGLAMHQNGRLSRIPNSTHFLSSPAARPSQVSFTPDGTRLVVTERETNAISVFPINSNGTLQNPMVTPSTRPAPFGFDFSGSNRLIVSEAAPMDPIGSSASSYDLTVTGISVVSPAVLNGQMASCWVTISPGGDRAYVSNTASNTVTTYGVAADGTLSVRQAAVPAGGDGSAPIDAGINDVGRLFFQLLGGKGTIAVYRVNGSGDLALIAIRNTGLPMLGSQGLTVLR
jgi:6-phosphogluconolactonase